MRLASRVGAALIGVLSLIVITAWYVGVETLPAKISGLWLVKPMTGAACLLLSVAVLVLQRRRVTLVLGFTVAVIGALTFAEYVFGLSLGVDELLPGIDFAGQPARMSPATAVSLILLGASVVVSRLARPAWMLGLALGTLTISLIAVLGYAYGVSSLYTVGGFTSMALPTALELAVLSVSILLQRPSSGLIALLRV
ncbi:MAG: hypothetical protein LH624_10830, partial [Cryobacterium sp.]|nr:hypothetical protein [Cryobacterium sp.]